MKLIFKFITGILLLTVSFEARAQFRSPGLPPGFHHALLDVLTGGSPFSARVKILVSNATNQDVNTMAASLNVYSGSMRLEIDGPEINPNVSQAELANLKGLHTIAILRPDTNRMYMIYPAYSSYLEVAYSKSTGMDAAPPPTIIKTPLGKEQVGIRECAKSLWSINEVDGEHYDVTIWTSTNFHNFPIQVRVGTPPATVEFENLQFEAPDRNLFVPPTGYYKYEGIQEMILKATQKAPSATNSP